MRCFFYLISMMATDFSRSFDPDPAKYLNGELLHGLIVEMLHVTINVLFNTDFTSDGKDQLKVSETSDI